MTSLLHNYFFIALTLSSILKSFSHLFACSVDKCTIVDLNGEWDVSNDNGSISLKGLVPGQIHLDLLKEGLIPEPYKGFNDVELAWIALEKKWVYSKNFTLPFDLIDSQYNLLWFEGIDTIASIFLSNEKFQEKTFLFNASNQHREYVYDVAGMLVDGSNLITVEFYSAATLSHKYALEYPYFVDQQFTYFKNTNRNFVRKAQSDFGWDWGPAFVPVGLWKSVSIISFSDFIISNFVPIVYWNETENAFEIQMSIYITGDQFRGKFVASLESIASVSETYQCVDTDCEVKMQMLVPVNKVDLWWPNGYGDQPLYTVTIEIMTEDEMEAKTSKRIGFRKVELVQEKYEGEDGLSFYFKINDRPVFVKGSNWIPADAFTGRVSEKHINLTLSSAVISHQNMIRVWGGGIYQQDVFYDLCNQKGLMVWQEFMFACSLYPRDVNFLRNVGEEIKHQVRRLGHHPSIIMWSGNNENQDSALLKGTGALVDYATLYDDVVRQTLYGEDTSRPFWPSSPSNGDLVIDISRGLYIQRWGESQNPIYGDIHHYDYNSVCTDVSKFPRPRFASEYGYQSYPSLYTLHDVINDSSDLDNDSPLMLHRQHHPNGNPQLEAQVGMHFLLPNNTDKAARFGNFVYLTQIVQGICMQAQTEHYRRIKDEVGHTMGTLYWQLNDIWQGQSWASIEYSGRWKILHYLVKRFYAPMMVSGYHVKNDFYLYVINDQYLDFNVSADLSVMRWSGEVVSDDSRLVPVKSYTSTRVLTYSNLTEKCPLQECFVYMELLDFSNNDVLAKNFYFPVPFKDVSLPKAQVKVEKCSQAGEKEFNISVSATKLALYVFLETSFPGYFSDNALIMKHEIVHVVFYAWADVNEENLCSSITVRSVASVYTDN